MVQFLSETPLALEWDTETNGPLDPQLKTSSKADVSWLCTNPNACCQHTYQARISSRICNKSGCNKCSRMKTCDCRALRVVNPSLFAQIHPTRNAGIDLNEVSVGSNQKIWWKCDQDPCGCHEWQASPANRTKSNCPYCSSKKLCPHNNFAVKFPQFAAQWDHENNESKLPSDFAPSSPKIVSWVCRNSDCGCVHRWTSSINRRTNNYKQSQIVGCPICINRRDICIHKSIVTTHPHLAAEWDYRQNGDLRPEQIAPQSNKIVHWRCAKNPRHTWRVMVQNRTKNHSNCPYCVNQRIDEENCLATLLPEITTWWSPANEKTAAQVGIGAKYKAKWVCPKGHKFNRQICVMTRTEYPKCPSCGTRFSPRSIHWLESISQREGIHIQHARNSGEYFVPGTRFKADGYCAETNTIYEYNGCFYHGHPACYNPEHVNPVNDKTFGTLHAAVVRKENRLRALGYNVVSIWECEYNPAN